jgi:hypothetical protein
MTEDRLFAIVKELAESDTIQVAILDGKCIFCLGTDKHEADCLIVCARNEVA